MSRDGGRQVCERAQLLELTRAHDREQTLDRAFTLLAAGPKHDLPPLNCRAERSFSGIVRRLNAVLVHEGEEVLIVHEERVRQIAHVGVGRIEIPLAEGEEPFLNRQHFRGLQQNLWVASGSGS